MTRGTLTRAASLPQADRKWRIVVLTGVGLIVALQLAFAVIQYNTSITNRRVGTGNRVVQCTTLAQVAPDLNLEECRQ